MSNPIYPDVEIVDNNVFFEIKSSLRKEKDGEWYEWLHVHKYYKKKGSDITCEEKIKHLNIFHSQIYSTIILGEVQTDAKSLYGDNLFPKSKYQTSEKDRIKGLFNI